MLKELKHTYLLDNLLMFNRREFVLVGEHVNESLEYKMLIQNIQVGILYKEVILYVQEVA